MNMILKMNKQLKALAIIKKYYLFGLLFLSCQSIYPIVLNEGFSQKKHHSRGIAFNSKHLIFTGTKGTYTLLNKSEHTILLKDKVETEGDLRGVYLFSNNSFIAISSAEDAKIFHVKDSVKQLVFSQKNMFLDGVDFWADEMTGIIYGDPVKERFTILKTTNGGLKWQSITSENIPLALENEAGFAASGTGIQLLDNGVGYIATGVSKKSRILKTVDYGESWKAIDTPIKSGGSFGIYSLNFWSEKEGVIIGGSYEDTLSNEKIAYITEDGGFNWRNISKGLPGYMSCVQSGLNGKLLICTGRLGTYYSLDKGKTWSLFTSNSFYTVKIDSNKIYLSGRNGKYAIYSI